MRHRSKRCSSFLIFNEQEQFPQFGFRKVCSRPRYISDIGPTYPRRLLLRSILSQIREFVISDQPCEAILNMSLQTAGDLPLQITSENSSSERRITPSWTIGQLKAKLEPITGIPPLSQKLTLKLGSQQSVPLEAIDEENTQLGSFPLAPYAEIHVSLCSLPSTNRFSLRETVHDTPLPCFVMESHHGWNLSLRT